MAKTNKDETCNTYVNAEGQTFGGLTKLELFSALALVGLIVCTGNEDCTDPARAVAIAKDLIDVLNIHDE